MAGEEKFSKFSVTSYGGGGGFEKTKDIPTRIDLLRHRVLRLFTMIEELSMLPRMPYTQGHSASQILRLVEDGNTEPDWDDDGLPTTAEISDTTDQITSTYNTTGTRKIKKKTTTKNRTFQPWTMVTSTYGNPISFGTDVNTTTPTLSNPTTTTKTTQAIGEARKGKKYHWETTVSGTGWVVTSTFTQTDWPDDFDPGTSTIDDTFFVDTTLPPTTRSTPGDGTTTSSP